ncbi:flavin-dependent oxidoreductase [Plantactinospora endophytica]|uniref:Flavin-dependent oxidoreductase n=1 Tax=Plantactinospora endophytica TaxID=673535 RepID=A0ABQ4E6T9_9ACTN|nr:flavin-dependent oxidoreductase [Plantactinospora endophytica]
MSLHAAGLGEVTVLETAPEIRPLGAGVNLLPNGVRELAALGVAAELARVAVPIHELVYYTRHGEVIWREPRGRAAGHRWPQLAVHRGRAQMVLLAAVLARLGRAAVRTDARVTDFVELPTGRLRLALASRDGAASTTDGDALVGADGIHSAVRRTLFPAEGPPVWQRQVVWRGIARIPAFADGRSMVIGGDRTWKVVAYPISPEPGDDGLVETNWAMARALGPDERADRSTWDRSVDSGKLLAVLDGWRFADLDVAALVAATPAPFEQPMNDRDPLPRWSFGPVTLVGDAAHPMCPMGSNGTTQSVLDARALAHALATHAGPGEAFLAYEAERRRRTTLLQQANRALGPEVVVALADGATPEPSVQDRSEVASPAELAEISRRYATLAGSDTGAANAASPYAVPGPDDGAGPQPWRHAAATS